MIATSQLESLSLESAAPGARYAVHTASGTVYAIEIAADGQSAAAVRMRGEPVLDDDSAVSKALFGDGDVIEVEHMAFSVGRCGTLLFHDPAARVSVSEAEYGGTTRTTTTVLLIERIE